MPEDRKFDPENSMVFLPIGVGVGVAIGAALRNIGVGIAIGSALGTIASLIVYQIAKQKE
ncbi:MAG TPA: hypothetical protein VMW28_04795 [Pelolinea sp.]|nr:hypothetical protein [Pelolinea sp.]